MDLENQKRVKEFAEEYGPENVVVIVGAAEGEAAGLAAETVTAGDPTFAEVTGCYRASSQCGKAYIFIIEFHI